MIRKIKESVTHQGIGGKEFRVDEEVTKTLTNDIVFEKAILEGNWACKNFKDRRPDFKHDFLHKLYYVKVDGIGYIIAHDEIDIILEPHEDLNNINFDPNDIGNGSGGGAGAMACATSEHKIEPINLGLNPVDFQQELIKNIGKMTTEDITKSINSRMLQGGGRYGA